MSKTKACKHVGIAFNTYLRAYKANEEFRTAVDLAERESWDIAVEGLRAAVLEQEPWAIQFVMKSHRGIAREWDGQSVVKVEHSGTVQHEIGAEGLDALIRSLEERKAELVELGPGAAVLDVSGREASG